MISSNNINIASRSVLSSPGAIRSELPLSLDAVIKVMEARQEICDILDEVHDDRRTVLDPRPGSRDRICGAAESSERRGQGPYSDRDARLF